MAQEHRKYRLFKVLMAAGVVLGFLLLVQTFLTYYYVSSNMTLQEARRDAARKVEAVEKAVRAAGEQPENVTTILEDSIEDWKEVAWIRVLNADGSILAAASTPGIDARNPLRGVRGAPSVGAGLGEPEIRQTPAGRVLVARAPFLASPPARRGRTSGTNRPSDQSEPGARGRPVQAPRRTVEIALILDSVSTSFASLRLYLIVGVSGALALMTALIVIRLRFPHYLRGQQIEAQLELARRVQADLLPSGRQVSPNLDFATECISAWEVGGDFCDVFNISGGRTAIVLGDVSGKGISAALLMALIHGAIHSSSWTQSRRDHEDASRSLNALLCKKTARERFASLFWGMYDPKDSILRYINAGHLPPLLLRSDHGEPQIQRLETGGPVLGLLSNIAYEQGALTVKEGDLLVAFSDGVVEAMNSAGDEFGDSRLIAAIHENWNNSPDAIRAAILEHLGSFLKEAPAHDDQTLIVVRFKQPARPADHAAAPEESAAIGA